MFTYDDTKEGDVKYACVSVASIDDSSPGTPCGGTPVTPRARTWGNDSVKEEGRRRVWSQRARWKVRWTWALHEALLSVWHAAKWLVVYVLSIPGWRYIRGLKKQCLALCLVTATAVAPMIALGYFTPQQYYGGASPFVGIFQDKVMGCGDDLFGVSQNATVRGIEKLFVLDQTFGKFSFSQVKTIDILWDLLVGRGVQLLAWWAAYTVFSDALLRAIERHPTSFSIFQRIALEGPGLGSLWTLTRELWVAKSKRTRALFLYMLWSTVYVLFVPIVLGAMTGYDSTSIAWINPDGSNNIVPSMSLPGAWVIEGTVNTTFSHFVCQNENLYWQYQWIDDGRYNNCDCRLPNGTMATAKEKIERYSYYGYKEFLYDDCAYDYPNNTQTWHGAQHIGDKETTYQCNSTMEISIQSTDVPILIDAQYLKGNAGYCFGDIGYRPGDLYDKSRCLPDTADPTYQWGFSTLMSGLFVMFTTVWVLSMYVLWQDAQFNSTLVKEGYQMTPLRAAFAMAKAAKRRTGLGEKQLVRANTKDLEKELYGGRGKRRTKIEYDLFVHDPEGGDEEPRRSPGVSTVNLKSPDSDSHIQAISDEELRARYMRGVQEARLSRKPLASETERFTPGGLKRRTTDNDTTTTIYDGEREKRVLQRRTTAL